MLKSEKRRGVRRQAKAAGANGRSEGEAASASAAGLGGAGYAVAYGVPISQLFSYAKDSRGAGAHN